MNHHPLNEKRIWVFGGAGNLGTPITVALDAAGAQVVCADRVGQAAKLIDAKNLQSTCAAECDLFDLDSIPAIVDRFSTEYGTPDGIVNLVSNCSRGKTFDEISAADFLTATNGVLTSGFLLGRAVAERMKAEKRPGSLVFFSSMYGMISPDPAAYVAPQIPNPVDYGAMKAGLLQMARYFAVRYAPFGIRSNCVTPGAFPSPAFRQTSTATLDALMAKVPMKRFGHPDEIAGPTLFLLSDAASYVTGHSLVVDGGWTAW